LLFGHEHCLYEVVLYAYNAILELYTFWWHNGCGMDDEEKQQLEETHQLAKENNDMLHAMRREALIGRVVKVFMVLAAIGIPLYLYFSYVQPYLEEARETFQDVQGQMQRVEDAPDSVPWLRSLFGGDTATDTTSQ
jgi:hypothetical protein